MTHDPYKKDRLNLILLNCIGVAGIMIGSNGILLSWFSFLELSDSTILIILTLPNKGVFLFAMLAAFWADRIGKKCIGNIGSIIQILGFTLLFISSFLQQSQAISLGVISAFILGIGFASTFSSWFALMKPLVPEEIRGRFFGQIRMTVQTCSILIGIAITWFLSQSNGVSAYQVILGFILLTSIIRAFMYLRIPEVTPPTKKDHVQFRPAIMNVIRVEGYLPYCAYIFLLTFVTAGVPNILGLLEKEIFNFQGNDLVAMANFMVTGSIIGFFIGGQLVDRWGVKPVFICCHFSYALVISIILLRSFIPWEIYWTTASVHLLFGIVNAAASIAISTEMMGLIPKKNQSLSTSFFLTLTTGSITSSAYMVSFLFKGNLLSEEWFLFGNSLSKYDTILLFFAFSIMILVITLGLVPSIMKKPKWLPVNHQ